jgi:hypothetical protein
MQDVRVPLISVTRAEGDENHTRIQYFTANDGTLLLDAEILKEYIPSKGPVDDMTLVQLFVTPHEHLAVIADVLSYAKAGRTSGSEWEAILARAEALLAPPSR